MNFIEQFFSKYSQEQMIRWFKRICLAEAVSWFFLFTAMIWIRTDKESILPTIYIIVIGNLHGLFFSMYLLFLSSMRKIYQWDDEDTVFTIIAAFCPFATIWIDKKLARFDRE
ncbi:DUF3817 domain-containing protein [Chryseobacterium sp. RR2-3-20]|uniref:DUF3817 domain-containing protein n=1 Tax=Chryseobacterium sp. RR2-3-20 TaxID=2787626 RepID=UPI001ADF83E4|nr:DUF3817 domain-containing protein [Chryseobacterium sp. RR2-3-20]